MAKHHISLPKSSLMRFSNNGVFHYLDLLSNTIKTCTAKSYNTGENYYPPEIEKQISNNIETILGRINNFLLNFRQNETPSSWTYRRRRPKIKDHASDTS